jgi:hypothetical protein
MTVNQAWHHNASPSVDSHIAGQLTVFAGHVCLSPNPTNRVAVHDQRGIVNLPDSALRSVRRTCGEGSNVSKCAEHGGN